MCNKNKQGATNKGINVRRETYDSVTVTSTSKPFPGNPVKQPNKGK